MSTASNVRFHCLTAFLLASAAAWSPEAARANNAFLLAAIIAEEHPAPRLSTALLVPLLSDVVDDAGESPTPIVRLLKSTIDETDGEDAASAFDEAPPEQAPEPAAKPAEPPKDEETRRASPGVDPDFAIWQQRAEDKLKLEQGPKIVEHPLAKENPNDFIIVCEAGCRHDPDEIVSRVARPERLARASGSLEPTSSSPDDDADQPNPSQPDNLDPAVIRCEAGCYGRTKSYAARLPRTAALGAVGRLTTAIATASVPTSASRAMIAPQSAGNGAIVGPHYTARTAEARPQKLARVHVVQKSNPVVRRTRHAFERGTRIAVPQLRRRRVAALSD